MRTFTIEAAANANRLSMAVMLICTNDGFTGVSGVRLPDGFEPVVFETAAYDAGSEENTELFPDIVDPCQVIGPQGTTPPIPNGNNAALPEDGGTVFHHAGIQGTGDLEPDTEPMDRHGWTDPVARITVRRLPQGGVGLQTSLSGDAEVPGPGDPDGSGSATITLNQGQQTVCFNLNVADIMPATAAHIHRGAVDEAGPVVVTLDPPTDGSSSGCVEDVAPSLIKEIRKTPSAFYVNVHNDEFPPGALRGQLSR